MEEKRKRGKNFSQNEELLLVELVEDHRHILENKKSDAVTWKQKETAWKKVAELFSSQSGFHRDPKSLKDKFESLKRRSRVQIAAEKASTYRTGGGRSENATLSATTERVAALMGDYAAGMQNTFDADSCCRSSTPKNNIDPNKRYGSSTPEYNIDINEITEGSIAPEKTIDLIKHSKGSIAPEIIIDLNKSSCGKRASETNTPKNQQNLENVISEKIDENEGWSSWNSNNLQNPKSKKLKVDGLAHRKRNLDDERVALTLLQQNFYKEENRRAEEKHEQEHIGLKLKNELLQLQVQEKKMELSLSSIKN